MDVQKRIKRGLRHSRKQMWTVDACREQDLRSTTVDKGNLCTQRRQGQETQQRSTIVEGQCTKSLSLTETLLTRPDLRLSTGGCTDSGPGSVATIEATLARLGLPSNLDSCLALFLTLSFCKSAFFFPLSRFLCSACSWSTRVFSARSASLLSFSRRRSIALLSFSRSSLSA